MAKKFNGVVIRNVSQSCKVDQFFSLKCASPLALAANVVYKFKCSFDKSISYIGKTERHLVVRAREHLNSGTAEKSAVGKHITKCTLCQNQASIDNFEILRQCHDNMSLSVHETLLIRKHNPSLNVQLHDKGGILLKIF